MRPPYADALLATAAAAAAKGDVVRAAELRERAAGGVSTIESASPDGRRVLVTFRGGDFCSVAAAALEWRMRFWAHAATVGEPAAVGDGWVAYGDRRVRP